MNNLISKLKLPFSGLIKYYISTLGIFNSFFFSKQAYALGYSFLITEVSNGGEIKKNQQNKETNKNTNLAQCNQ